MVSNTYPILRCVEREIGLTDGTVIYTYRIMLLAVADNQEGHTRHRKRMTKATHKIIHCGIMAIITIRTVPPHDSATEIERQTASQQSPTYATQRITGMELRICSRTSVS